MELNELARQIERMKKSAKGKLSGAENGELKPYLNGYLDALNMIADRLRKAKELERIKLRMERLQDEIEDGGEPDWDEAVKSVTSGAKLKVVSAIEKEAA